MARHYRRHYARARRYLRARTHHRKQGRFARLFARPSKLIAGALGLGSLLELFGPPLPNGDGVAARAQAIMTNPTNPLATDQYGNNILSVTADQMAQNAIPAIGFAIGAAIVAGAGRIFHF